MKLWAATKNSNKAREIRQILGDKIEISTLLDVPNFPEIAETGNTFEENALIKVQTLWNYVREPAFADDSGLEVDALKGAPGVHSSRFSAPEPSDSKNIDKLFAELKDVPAAKRTARFRCVIVFLDENGSPRTFEGTLEGLIGFERKGTNGFGYDPVFILPGKNRTLAEISAGEKNLISHRGKAVEALFQFLKVRYNIT
ncbi:MAG: RdgB/HAM1 family non-canonical purine NTP pyrophosphatase [Candidatus Riflebacteria bacterium]|nr:RdgB/HAM1 family non-canonical purine NTP pyrophosphatase [Candidatus Riflebacteria bacterium]